MATLSIPVYRTFQGSFKTSIVQTDGVAAQNDTPVMGANLIRNGQSVVAPSGKSFGTLIG